MRIHLFLTGAALLLGYANCRKLQKGESVTSPQPVERAASDKSWRASRVFDGEHPDTAAIIQSRQPPALVHVPVESLPPPSASRKAYLATGWWHLNMAFQPSDTLVHLNYQSKWLHFGEDQSFDVLIDGKVVDSGKWTWDDNTNVLYLSCPDPYINNSWSVIDKGFVMIWRGNTDLNVTGIQVRVANSRTNPFQ